MCDIDHFKKYNDQYGHSVGDECIKKVAQIILNNLNRPSDFCARYGGEEFIIILPRTNLEGSSFVADRIRASVSELKLDGNESKIFEHISISLGVASVDGDKEIDYEELIKQADKALYTAKEKGRNCVEVYDGQFLI